jgi:hypothetical protein
MKRFITALALTAAMMLPAGAALAAGPAAHGVDGRDFGGAVSNLAKYNTGALVSHVSGGRR